MYKKFTSESVSKSHPDKICDQISDAILDECLRADPMSRVAIDTVVTKNKVILFGEISINLEANQHKLNLTPSLSHPKKIDYEKIARQVIAELGYCSTNPHWQPNWGFSDQVPIEVYIHEQAADISSGVDNGGAGDQGIMYGYACQETPELMPLPIMMAHLLVKKLDEAREQGIKNLQSQKNSLLTDQLSQWPNYLHPDGKSEVIVTYKNNQPVDIEVVILACPHHSKISNQQLSSDLQTKIILPALNHYLPGRPTNIPKIIVNGTGRWEIGGPASDSGLTGKKIAVDTYGGMARIGGGAFSGKDATKVDRSGAYAARYIAKNILAADLADRCGVQLAYVIGQAKPVVFEIDCFETEKKELKIIKDFAKQILNPTVNEIINQLDLRKPIFKNTAKYGHFGNKKFKWEKIFEL